MIILPGPNPVSGTNPGRTAVAYESEAGDFTLALGGDFMLTQRIRVYQEPGYLTIVEAMRNAVAAFVNLETTVRRWDEGTPTVTTGTPMTTVPELLDELKWLGIDIVSCANNHAYDYGENGVLATLRHLDAADIPHAGSGRNLTEARMPAYVETKRGRVALIATTATFRPWNKASNQRSDITGRPGINPLGFKTTYTVDGATFDTLRAMNVELGFAKEQERARKHFYSDKEVARETAQEIQVFGQRVVKGDGFSITTQANADDVNDNLRWIREARRQADWVVVSVHCHEFNAKSLKTATAKVELSELADFVQEFARQAIDAGADVVVGHGSHTALGIEIYKGKPIFYSLGGLLFQNETVPFIPAEAYERFDLPFDATPADLYDGRTAKDKKGFPAYPGYWECFVPICEYRGGELAHIRLLPTDLGYGRPRYQRGRAVLADKKLAVKILERLQRLSQPFGTKIDIEDGIGVITVPSSVGRVKQPA
jgi:poly-gamma-glutamate synthesis protein (capsule biosynthesis protein)